MATAGTPIGQLTFDGRIDSVQRDPYRNDSGLRAETRLANPIELSGSQQEMQWQSLSLLVVLGVGVGFLTGASGCAEQPVAETVTEEVIETAPVAAPANDLGQSDLGMESGSTLGADLGGPESGSTLGDDLGGTESGSALGDDLEGAGETKSGPALGEEQ